MQNFINYLKDTRAEMKHVSWPTKDQTIAYTILVIALSLFVSVLLGVFDAGFTKAMEFLISR
jgi:preprotein translocase subunit SecE